MELVKLQWISKTIASAKAMGLQIAIVDTDGITHGGIEEKKRKAKCPFKFGEVTKHIGNHLPAEIKIGEVYEVPGAEFGIERVRSTVSAALSKKYGRDAHVTSLNREADSVQVMRTA